MIQALKTPEKLTHAQWEPLVAALRLELQEYGGLLNLLEDQQRSILGQDTDALLETNRSIEHQMEANFRLRDERESMVAALAQALGLPQRSRVRDLLPSFPDATRPMLDALLSEINSLIGQSRRRLKQNQLLLHRAAETTEKLLFALSPNSVSKTYTKRGNVTLRTPAVYGARMQTTA